MRPYEIARQYIGQTEKPGNMGFTDVEFERKMQKVGFQKTHAWCAYFTELVFKEAYPERLAELDKLFSASTIQTFRNFRDAGHLIGNVPQLDALVIWQRIRYGSPQPFGHAGVVSKVIDVHTFKSIEGNTNDEGGPEGYIVAEKDRKVQLKVPNGLKLLGFITV